VYPKSESLVIDIGVRTETGSMVLEDQRTTTGEATYGRANLDVALSCHRHYLRHWKAPTNRDAKSHSKFQNGTVWTQYLFTIMFALDLTSLPISVASITRGANDLTSLPENQRMLVVKTAQFMEMGAVDRGTLLSLPVSVTRRFLFISSP